MDFASDNRAPAAPAILDAIVEENRRYGAAYGEDEASAEVERMHAALFETEVTAWSVVTGTAANSLALASLCPPWGAVLCHDTAHVTVDECAAPEWMAGGAKLVGVDGPDGKMTPEGLRSALARLSPGSPHSVQPAAISITQPTEVGTCYAIDELDELVGVAREHGLRVHLDGARFANAVCALDVTPSELSWRRGVDVLSLGATKSGAVAAESVVFFDRDLADGFAWRRKRAGQLVSKMRFVAAQLRAWLAEDRWRQLASHANAMADRLATGLSSCDGVGIVFPRQVNMVFAQMATTAVQRLRDRGCAFFDWGPASDGVVRLVTSHATTPDDVDHFVSAVRDVAG